MLINIHKNNQIKRIEAFADTHGRHREFHYDCAAADILVCAGDVCDWGDEAQLRDFFAWFAEQPARHKLFVAGNHDLPFCRKPKYAAQHYIPDGVACIENGGVTLNGVDFYVLPARLRLREPLYLPQGVDVLVTHGAPSHILDEDGRWGCPILLDLVRKAQPKIHIFGHVHENGQQTTTLWKTNFYNVAEKESSIVKIIDDVRYVEEPVKIKILDNSTKLYYDKEKAFKYIMDSMIKK